MLRTASPLFAAAALLALTACSTPTSPASGVAADALGQTCPSRDYTFVGLQRIAPPPAAWATWYAQAEECAGIRGRFDRVRWFTVEEIRNAADGTASGFRGMACADDVYLTSTAEDLVRHELLHHILDRPGHPAEFFPRCAENLVGS